MHSEKNIRFVPKLFFLFGLLPLLFFNNITGDDEQDLNSPVESVGFISDKSGVIASGFFINKNTFVTNFHVTNGLDVKSAVIEMKDGNTIPVKDIIKEYRNTDLAFIRTEEESDNTLTIETDDKPKVNDEVYSIGNPTDNKDRVDYFKTTKGRIRKILNDDWYYDNENNDHHEALVIQHTAIIKPGNSGGPLVNNKGKVIGVNTFFYDDSLNYAIHVDELLSILKKNKIPFNEIQEKKEVKKVKKVKSLRERFYHVIGLHEYYFRNYYLILISGVLLYYMLITLIIISLLTYTSIKGTKKKAL